VLVDKDGHAAAITFQTFGMRKLFAKFPEVVLVDTTYCTNTSRYKLFSFMVTDAFGKGQFVQHAFISHETVDIMSRVLKIFRDNNPASRQTTVFVVSVISIMLKY
jgi:hypothetical protein